MYLSKLVPNLRVRAARRDLADPYEMHRTLTTAIGDSEGERILWRLDMARDRRPFLLVQSQLEPEWNRISSQFPSYFSASPLKKLYDPILVQGTRLAFRLRANPSVKRDGKRHGLNTQDDQIAWLQRKATVSGFQLLQVRVRDEHLLTAKRRRERIQLASALYEGRLLVQDTKAFRTTLERGIGPAKGFGFGLLSIAVERG